MTKLKEPKKSAHMNCAALRREYNKVLGEWWDQRAQIDKLLAEVKELEARVRNVAAS